VRTGGRILVAGVPDAAHDHHPHDDEDAVA
jgi:hypothetical protein